MNKKTNIFTISGSKESIDKIKDEISKEIGISNDIKFSQPINIIGDKLIDKKYKFLGINKFQIK